LFFYACFLSRRLFIAPCVCPSEKTQPFIEFALANHPYFTANPRQGLYVCTPFCFLMPFLSSLRINLFSKTTSSCCVDEYHTPYIDKMQEINE